MKTYALIVLGLLAAQSPVAHSETPGGITALSPAQMDSITAGITLPGTSSAIVAAAEASGLLAMTGTNTLSQAFGTRVNTGWGYGLNVILASGALATATGSESRETSYSSSDDENGTTPLGAIIFGTMTFGPTQITGYSSLQPTGLLVNNLLHHGAGVFWGW